MWQGWRVVAISRVVRDGEGASLYSLSITVRSGRKNKVSSMSCLASCRFGCELLVSSSIRKLAE